MVDEEGLSITTSKQLSITGASVTFSAPKITHSAKMEMGAVEQCGQRHYAVPGYPYEVEWEDVP